MLRHICSCVPVFDRELLRRAARDICRPGRVCHLHVLVAQCAPSVSRVCWIYCTGRQLLGCSTTTSHMPCHDLDPHLLQHSRLLKCTAQESDGPLDRPALRPAMARTTYLSRNQHMITCLHHLRSTHCYRRPFASCRSMCLRAGQSMGAGRRRDGHGHHAVGEGDISIRDGARRRDGRGCP